MYAVLCACMVDNIQSFTNESRKRPKYDKVRRTKVLEYKVIREQVYGDMQTENVKGMCTPARGVKQGSPPNTLS